MKEIDARGLACPAPVLLVKDVIESEAPETITVRVDNQAAAENVCRFMESQAFEASLVEEEGSFQVTGGRKGEGAVKPVLDEMKPDQDVQKVMVMVTTDRMGFGDDELGQKLMVNFLKTIGEMGDDLWRLVFVNAGVKLTIEGAEALEALKDLENGGLHILVCGTCLNHFQLLEKKQVGQTTNMLDIVMAMQFADKVINL